MLAAEPHGATLLPPLARMKNMGDRLLQLLDFFLERPPLTGALVCGALYLLKRSRKPQLTAAERRHEAPRPGSKGLPGVRRQSADTGLARRGARE